MSHDEQPGQFELSPCGDFDRIVAGRVHDLRIDLTYVPNGTIRRWADVHVVLVSVDGGALQRQEAGRVVFQRVSGEREEGRATLGFVPTSMPAGRVGFRVGLRFDGEPVFTVVLGIGTYHFEPLDSMFVVRELVAEEGLLRQPPHWQPIALGTESEPRYTNLIPAALLPRTPRWRSRCHPACVRTSRGCSQRVSVTASLGLVSRPRGWFRMSRPPNSPMPRMSLVLKCATRTSTAT